MSKDLRAFTPVILNGEKMLIPTAFIEISKLRVTKSEDYNGSDDVTLRDYFPFGMVSYVQMIWTKTLRLRNLTASKAAPNHEGIRDTLKDLINYACFAIEELDGVIEGSEIKEDLEREEV